MSENKNTTNQQEEEVDLGKLFVLIGKGFSKLFTAIGNFLLGIKRLLILFALFIKRNLILVGAVTILGLSFGLYKDITAEPKFEASMVVNANYDSKDQLYYEVVAINNAASNKKRSPELFKRLGLEKETDFFEVEIEPGTISNLQKLKMFNGYLKGLDSLNASKVDFDKFIEDLSVFDYPRQKITVTATNPIAFTHFKSLLFENVNKNGLISSRKKAKLAAIKKQEEKTKEAISDLDTLMQIQNQALIAESKKENSATSIITATQSTSNNGLELYTKRLGYVKVLNSLAIEKASIVDTIQILSDFSQYTIPEFIFYETKTVIFGVLSFILIIFILSIVEFNKYLNREMEALKKNEL